LFIFEGILFFAFGIVMTVMYGIMRVVVVGRMRLIGIFIGVFGSGFVCFLVGEF
jgi:hypothetical protein